MDAQGARDKKGDWIRVAPCLYRYRNNEVYYAVLRRDGKLIRRSLQTHRLEVAKRKLRDLQRDVEAVASDSHAIRFDEYMGDFLAGRTGAPKTLKRYRQLLKEVKSSWPGGASGFLRDVDLSQCTRWLGQWNGKAAAYNHAREWLLAFFEYAVANRKIPRPPLDPKIVKPMRRPKVIRNAPTPAEFEAILTAVRSQALTDHGEDSGNVLEFLGRAGVGQAEATGLCWQDVDLKGGTVKLFRFKTRTAFQIPIFPKLRPLLERLHEENLEAAPADRVFKISNPKKGLAAACARLGLPNFSPRSLRRMFIIEALNRQVPVKTISRWQGHQDGGVLILKTYSEIIEQGVHQQAANLLA